MGAIKGRLLGIDHGLKRIGLAVSDPSGLVARELAIIKRTSKAADFTLLHDYANKQGVIGFVVGLPSNLDLPEGVRSQAKTVQRWVEQFRETTALPIVLWDEQMSSVDAQELSRQKRRHVRDPIDDLAARLILQSYLDAVRDGLAAPPDITSQEGA